MLCVLRLQNSRLAHSVNLSSVLPPKPAPEAVQAVKRLIIKCADLSNTVRPTELCRQWATRVSEEYFDQAGAFIAGFSVVNRSAALKRVWLCNFLCLAASFYVVESWTGGLQKFSYRVPRG